MTLIKSFAGLLTPSSLYILEVILYCDANKLLIQSRNICNYNTRARENLQNVQHAFESLPLQIGITLF